ncbi:ribonuclease P protein subunit p29 [Cloeon dipterum]|uniref:ribonuclease P protein subunit p29 n=1 Tax=Cloeon dipterum TaxID=197152 RepID=UPI00321FC214
MESVNDLYLKVDGRKNENFLCIQTCETKKFIESVIPANDRGEIDNELRKRFPLEMPPKKKAIVRQKKQKLSHKEMEKLNLRKLPKKGMKYTDYIPLNELWTGYMTSYIDLNEIRNGGGVSEQATLLLQKADYHGAVVKVVRSRCLSLVGVKGIILMDTKNTFQIICEDNSVKTIPKSSSLFEVHLEDITFTVFGKHFLTKPAERSTKKIKQRVVKDL